MFNDSLSISCPLGHQLRTKINIKERLSIRNFSTDLRNSGVKTRGPITLTKQNIQNFANELDIILNKSIAGAQALLKVLS